MKVCVPLDFPSIAETGSNILPSLLRLAALHRRPGSQSSGVEPLITQGIFEWKVKMEATVVLGFCRSY